MGIDKKVGRYCDGCGEPMTKAHKIHRTGEYCGSCYSRIFPRVTCSKCGNSAHPHRNDPSPPLCRKCAAADRKCIRCENPVPRAGLLFEGKAVCPSCVPYFREQQSCAHCQKESSRLSILPSAGITEKICESCRNRLTHATCSVCRKYRKVASESAEMGPRCINCTVDPAISHLCPDCGKTVAGNGKSRCRSCANKLALDREANLTAAVFTHEWAATLWRQFGLWLHGQQGGSPKLIAQIRSHQIYFERLDATFASALDLTGHTLLRLFGAAGLRSHLLPTRFIEQQLGVFVPAEAKVESSERERINELVRAVKSEPWKDVVMAYLTDLDNKGLSLRSIRMYLSTACQFARSVKFVGAEWTQGQIESFLNKKPGARNNLSRFVSFCRESMQWNVSMPSKGQVVAPIKDPLKSAERLAALVAKVESVGLENIKRSVVEQIIATALGVSKREIENLSAAQLQVMPDGVLLSLVKEDLYLPSELEPYGRRLLQYFSVMAQA